MKRNIASKTILVFAFFYIAALAAAQGPITVFQYPLPQLNSNPWQLTAGPDGAIWYTVSCPYILTCPTKVFEAIGRFTTDGKFTEYPLPDPAVDHGPNGITTGPDGALWFTELHAGKIGRISTSGIISEYALPAGSGPYKITAGPDGALWFTEMNINKIGRITTTGDVTEYPVEGLLYSTDPTDIVVGPDGALWFPNLNSHWIGRITTQGDMTKLPLPLD